MQESYLSKYYKDNNPVTDRLNLKSKMLIRLLVLAVCSLIFIIFRIINKHDVFDDIAVGLLIVIYIFMGLCAIVSFAGLASLLLSLIFKNKFNEYSVKIPFEKKKLAFIVLDWIMVVPVCICVAIFVFGYVCRVQMVDGPSMIPSFENGDRVVSIFDENIQRGDVIIFKTGEGDNERLLIKRVMGLSGDSVKWKDGILEINGKVIEETYISSTLGPDADCGKVPEGYVFVMGDNRGDSQDSRNDSIGLIPLDDIKGIVVVRFNGIKPSIVDRGVLE